MSENIKIKIMSKKLFSISLACVMLVFAACKKNNTDVPVPPTVVPKVKSFTISNGATVLNTATIQYDNSGRRIKQTFADGSWVDFNNTANTIIAEQFDAGGTSLNKVTYNLNAEGLVESYFTNSMPTKITYATYNTAKQLVSEITKSSGVITSENYYKYDNIGNVSTDSIIATNGTTIRTNEYYTDKISTTENSNIGAASSGMGNKNCRKKQTTKSPSNIITIIDYSIPEIDAQGRVTKQTYTSGGSTYSLGYSYY